MAPTRAEEGAPNLLDETMSLSEAAATLGFTEKSAQRMAVEGRFPGDAARKIGRRWVVSTRRLERWLHGEDVS